MPKTSIPAAGEAMRRNMATDEQIVSAMVELSTPIFDLMHMARITADIAERIFDCPDKPTGDRLTFSIHPGERDSFLFALNNIEERAKGLHLLYHGVRKGEHVQ